MNPSMFTRQHRRQTPRSSAFANTTSNCREAIMPECPYCENGITPEGFICTRCKHATETLRSVLTQPLGWFGLRRRRDGLD
ncbi:uncharacterized protein VDAG_05220, partial [Verticillium dahliae VdLs.17]